jgi:hypothetical protein
MTKNTQNILIALGAIALVGGGVAASRLLPQTNNISTASQTAAAVQSVNVGDSINPPSEEEINTFCQSWADKFGKMTKIDGYFDGKKYHFIFSTAKIPRGDLDLLKTERGWAHYDSDEFYSCTVSR